MPLYLSRDPPQQSGGPSSISPAFLQTCPRRAGPPALTGQRPVPPMKQDAVSEGGTGLWPVDFGVSPKSRSTSARAGT